MERSEDHSLILRPSHELIAPQIGANPILGEMVKNALALAKEIVTANIDFEALVSEGKRIQQRKGMTPEDIQAFGLFHQAATGRHPEAQYQLRDCYAYGFGIEKDRRLALEWLKKSAELGFAAAQYLLGEHYELGIDVSLDFDESERWFFLAAANGNAEAQCKVAVFYRDGLAGVRDYSTAADWYYKAAVQGNAEAQFELGLYFSGGRKDRSSGSCPDREFMKEYLNEQVTEVLANSFLGEKVSFDVLNTDTGEVVIQANRKITKTLLRRLARVRDELALPLSHMHDCIRDSIVRFQCAAVSWFRRAAAQGHADAQRNLALCYQNGDGIGVDLVQAFAWLQLAAVQKEELARSMLEQFGFVLTADKEAKEARKEAAVIASSMSSSELETAQNLYRNFRELYSKKD